MKNPLKVVLGKHRVSYVHVKTPTSFEEGGDSKYDTTFLIPKNHPDVSKIKAAIKEAYDTNKDATFGGRPLSSPKMWNPLRDGDEWLEDHPEAKEYEGVYFLKAASKSQPAVYDADKQDILDLDEVYSGCYCRGVIVCYPFSKKGNMGFGFFLNSLMKIEDGEPLGGAGASADDYEDEEETPKKPAPKKPAPRKRLFEVDEQGNKIYSDDGGVNWFFVE